MQTQQNEISVYQITDISDFEMFIDNIPVNRILTEIYQGCLSAVTEFLLPNMSAKDELKRVFTALSKHSRKVSGKNESVVYKFTSDFRAVLNESGGLTITY